MPVLATIATINILFRANSEQISFLDPVTLRARCNDVIEDTETRARAVMLTEELMQLSQQYNTAVASSVDAYLDRSAQWDSSANDLIKLLQPWDSSRAQTVEEIVRIWQSMRELLTAEQWNRVFG
jgi:hypothetical protein